MRSRERYYLVSLHNCTVMQYRVKAKSKAEAIADPIINGREVGDDACSDRRCHTRRDHAILDPDQAEIVEEP